MLQYTKHGNSSHPQAYTQKYLTHKHDILQTCESKGGHIKMAIIIKIGISFAMQLAYLVIIKISGRQGSLTQQPHELL